MFHLKAKGTTVLTLDGDPAVYTTRDGARRAAVALSGRWKTPVSIVLVSDDVGDEDDA